MRWILLLLVLVATCGCGERRTQLEQEKVIPGVSSISVVSGEQGRIEGCPVYWEQRDGEWCRKESMTIRVAVRYVWEKKNVETITVKIQVEPIPDANLNDLVVLTESMKNDAVEIARQILSCKDR